MIYYQLLVCIKKLANFEKKKKSVFDLIFIGEIVIWDEKDQGGYMIDNNGTWAKIEGRQWFGSSIFKSCSKTSLSKRLLTFTGLFRFSIPSF